MKRIMVLFAKGFPYGTSEPFLENEYPLYKEYFDKVLIVTAGRKNEQPTRVVSDPVIEIITDYTLSKDIKSIFTAFFLVLKDKNFYKECINLIKTSRFKITNLYEAFVISACGNHRAFLAKKWLDKNPDYKLTVIYSYWLQITAYAALKLKQKFLDGHYTISRAHGFDLYEERQKNTYIPFQGQIYNGLDEIASISENGKKYLENKYGNKNKISVYRLGAIDRKISNPYIDRKVIRIVSCARVVPVKRLEKIVDALNLITDQEVQWMHIGGGPLLEQLKEYAKKLPKNVRANFSGTISNADVYKIYAEQPFHIFLNVSRNEGIPVSIMEAMSFGIPVIATDVGGTSEVVDEGKTGFLLKRDYEDKELAVCIKELIEMCESDYYGFRVAARKKFEKEYNAIPNYRKFVEKLAQR